MSSVKESSRLSQVNKSINHAVNLGASTNNYVPYHKNRVTNERIKEQQVC